MWFRKKKDEQEVRPGKLAQAWKKTKRCCLLALIGLLALTGAYVAGILTVLIGPRHFGNFEFGIWPGEVVQVVRLNQEFTKPWFGIGEAKLQQWLYVTKPEWEGDFSFLASGDELELKPGDYVARESLTGQFLKLALTPKAKNREVAAKIASDTADLPLPPPPKASMEEGSQGGDELLPLELPPADRQRQAEYAAKTPAPHKRWDDEVKDLMSRFHPVVAEVPDEEVIYEGVPVKTALPVKISVGKSRR